MVCSGLPSDPYYYTCQESFAAPPVIIKFYGYGKPLYKDNVAIVLSRAIGETTIHLPQISIQRHVHSYVSGNVALIIHTKRLLNWGMLREVEKGIWNFVNEYEFVDFDFDLGAPTLWKERIYGTGALTHRASNP